MERLSKAFAAVGKVGEAISRTAQSAQELLLDQDLRSKGIQTVLSGAQSKFQGIQNGIGRIGVRLQDKQRQLQSLLQSIEERLNSSQRAWQLQASRRARVDVQFGRQLLAEAPQEVRARLWYVLLENPHLAAPIKCEHPGPIPNRSDEDEDGDHFSSAFAGNCLDPAAAAAAVAEAAAAAAALDEDAIGEGRARARGSVVGAEAGGGGGGGGRFAAVAAAALGLGRTSAGGGSFSSSPSNNSRRDRGNSASAAAAGEGGCSTPPPCAPSRPPALHPQYPYQQLPQYDSLQGGGVAGPGLGRGGGASGRAGTPSHPATDAACGSFDDPILGPDPDGWELVGGGGEGVGGGAGGGVPGSAQSAAAAGSHPEAIRLIMERLEALGPLPLDESGSDPVLVAQQAVLEAMLQVPWEAGVGLPPDFAPDCRFATLNEMTAGQEEVDDSILRDIHRTFPEHPYFGMEAGQRALFRVLKAYSLHDLEVAYCQGMAFMAGVLLMYVPEELAFRLFCRLMDPEGPNLRRLYLPGLDPLKAELATFEVLLSWRLPELSAHLTEFGLPPVLYVSQWLMTLFATPFPPPFCARVIDVLLQDGHDRLLLRCSHAVMEALEAQLLARRDFEALITHLKMEPVGWGINRQRAIMERALNSPITDEEIEVARETAANRQFLAAAAAAAASPLCTSAETSASAAAAAAPSAVASDTVRDVSGLAAAPTGTGLTPRELTFEHEVEAALVAAAAAMTAGSDGADACKGGDMISFEECREEGAAARRGGGRCSGPGGAARHLTRGLGGGEAAAAAAAATPIAAAAMGPGTSACLASGNADPSSYGVSASLLDEVGDFAAACRSGGAGATSASALLYGGGGGAGRHCTTHGPAPDPELEYGEYGEMLLDAGMLLPELGGAGTGAAAASPSVGFGAAAGAGGLMAGYSGIGVSSQPGLVGSGGQQVHASSSQQQLHHGMADLLLD